MSVLFKSPSNNSVSIGGSNKGFPPGDVSNITCIASTQKNLIKWTDPEDTIVDEAVFVKWKGTLLIRNSDHYPNNIKDGDVVIDNTIKNKYKDNYYEDNNLINNHVYYYRFFPYSEDKVYNDSSNLVFKQKPISYDPVLKNNTWSQIVETVESNSVPSTWKVGDEIDLTLSGIFNETVTMQIWGFNIYDKSNESGKANILFGMKDLMKDELQMNLSDTSNGGWDNSYMKNTIINNIFNSMPPELRNGIKEVNTKANISQTNYESKLQSSIDKLFIPAYTEADHDGTIQAEYGLPHIPIFTKNASLYKKLNNGLGDYGRWWTRTVSYDTSFMTIW